MQKLDGVIFVNLIEGIHQNKKINDRKERCRRQGRFPIYINTVIDLFIHDINQTKLRHFGESHAQKKAADQDNDVRNHCFPEQNMKEISFVHAENIIKSQFLFPAFDESRAGIKQKRNRKRSNSPAAHIKQDRQNLLARQASHHLRSTEEAENVKYHDHGHAGHKIWII